MLWTRMVGLDLGNNILADEGLSKVGYGVYLQTKFYRRLTNKGTFCRQRFIQRHNMGYFCRRRFIDAWLWGIFADEGL